MQPLGHGGPLGTDVGAFFLCRTKAQIKVKRNTTHLLLGYTRYDKYQTRLGGRYVAVPLID